MPVNLQVVAIRPPQRHEAVYSGQSGHSFREAGAGGVGDALGDLRSALRPEAEAVGRGGTGEAPISGQAQGR